jgi:hypothetical protein
MMRGGVIEEYVLCPSTLLKNSSMNRVHNDVRKDDIVAGREREGRPTRKDDRAKNGSKADGSSECSSLS